MHQLKILETSLEKLYRMDQLFIANMAVFEAENFHTSRFALKLHRVLRFAAWKSNGCISYAL